MLAAESLGDAIMGNNQVLHQAAQRKHCHLMNAYCVPGIKISALLVAASANHHFNSIYWYIYIGNIIFNLEIRYCTGICMLK